MGMRLSYFLLAVILLIYGLIIAKQFLYPLGVWHFTGLPIISDRKFP